MLYTHNYGKFDKFIDKRQDSDIVRVFGKNYKDRILLYKFTNDICETYKIYTIFENLISDSKKKELKLINDETIQSHFSHTMDNLISKDGIISSLSLKKPIDVNHANLKELTYFSYKLAEDFALKNKTFYINHKLSESFTIDLELLEFHTYILKNIETPKTGELDIHTDDRQGVTYDTITLIWYLYKDDSIDGGNISFYKDGYSVKKKQEEVLLKIFDDSTTITSNNKNKKCTCLIFTGDIEHSPQKLSGTGVRKSIVFQFRRVDIKEKTISIPKAKSLTFLKLKNPTLNTRKIKSASGNINKTKKK
tara:strand:- start:1350 stop:2270 length:921 start_codon:yes stop_codon:yes gene_type:complete